MTPLGTPTSSFLGSNDKEMGIPLSEEEKPIVGDLDLSPEALAKLRKDAQGKKLVQWVKSEYAKCKTAHTEIRNQWNMNLAFYKGDQYVQLMAGTVMKTQAPSRRVRLVINRVRPMIRTQLSQMTSQEPTAEIVPASTDIADLLAAEAGQAVYENCTIEYGLKKKFTSAAFWQATCGVGYIKTRWNKEGNKGLGCHEYSAPSPYHILVPELLVEEIEEQPYVLNIFTKPLEWVKQTYGDMIPKDHKPSVVSTTEIMETQYLNVKQSGRGSEPDACLFIEAWIKPGTHPDLPNGGLLTIVDDILIQACMDELPYSHGQYPFTKFDGVPSGAYYSTSAIEDFMQLQMELNRNRSQRAEARNLTSRPQWISPRGVIDVSKWRNEPGQVLEYTPGIGKPEVMPISQLPAYVVQEEENILRDMEDVSGQHQISKGQNPTGVTSGTAISFLQEADNSFMATVYLSIEEGMQKIGKQTLMLAVQYWDVARTIKVTGSDNAFSVKQLRGSDIKNGTDIRIESGSSLPVSRAARNAMFMDMMNRGALLPDQALKLMKIPNMKSYFDKAEADERQAQRENQKMFELPVGEIQQAQQQMDMMKNQMLAQFGIESVTMHPMGSQIEEMFNQPIIPVNDYDNHEKHMAEHAYFMKQQSFESLPQEVKDQFIKHWQAHKDKLFQDSLQQMMQMGTDMQGAVAQEGGGELGSNQFSGLPPADSAGVDEQAPVQ
jgi:hypothetical protein